MPVFRARFHDAATGLPIGEAFPGKWSVKRRQDNSGAWSFDVPLSLPFVDTLITESVFVTMLLDGESFIYGPSDKVKQKVSKDSVGYSVTGLGELDVMANVKALRESHYQDVPVIIIIDDLLGGAGWALGDISTVINLDINTTIDLRNEEHLLPQLEKTITSVPGNHYRFGGYNSAGVPLLDIGYFDQLEPMHLVSHALADQFEQSDIGYIGDLSVEKTFSGLLKEVYATGGTYEDGAGNQRTITLYDALVFNPALALDPNFPIVWVGDGDWKVVNNAVTTGGSIRKQFENHVTENNGIPNSIEVQQAAIAAYNKSVQMLREHAQPETKYSATVYGLRTLPRIGNRIRVDISQDAWFIDSFSGARAKLPGFELHDTLRVNEITLSSSKDSYAVKLTLSPYEYINYDTSTAIQLYMLLHAPGNFTFGAANSGQLWSTVKSSRVTVGPGLLPDCIVPPAEDAITFTVPMPTPPSWATVVEILGAPYSPTHPAMQYVIVTPPALPATDLILCANTGAPWTIADEMEVVVAFKFRE